jgi:hypothetical protein
MGCAPRRPRCLPGARRPELRQHEGLGRPASAQKSGYLPGRRVGVDAVDVDGRTAPVDELDPLSVDERGHGHCRMVRIEFLDHRRDAVDLGPDGRIVPVAETLHLVADAPDQQRRVVAIAQDELPCLLHLFFQLRFAGVIEAVALVTKPEADGHRHAERMRVVEQGPDVTAPCADRVGPRGGQRLQRRIASCATDEVGLAAAQELPALLGLPQLYGDGLGRCHGRERHRRQLQRGCKHDSTKPVPVDRAQPVFTNTSPSVKLGGFAGR